MEVRPTTTPVRRPYKGETRQITESERTQYGLPYAHYRVSCKDGRVVLPISGPNNELLGHILRDFTGTLTPKVLTYKDTDGPFIHWAVNMHGNKDIVIVEDWLSAEAVGRLGGVAGVALLGTHLTDEAQKQILHNASQAQVHVALDRDAFVKGVKLAAKLAACLWRPVFTWRLDKDLKHVRPERIERAINEREFDFISNP